MAYTNEFILNLVGKLNKTATTKQIEDAVREINDRVKTNEAAKIQLSVAQPSELSKNKDNIVKTTEKYIDNMGRAVTVNEKFSVSETGVTTSLGKTTTYLKDTTRAASSFANEMGAVIRRTLESATTLGLMYGALNQLRQGIQYVKDLNKEMTNIQVLQVEGAKTTEQINSLALSFNGLAKEMGASSIEVAAGSTEWLRQGKTIEETRELLRSTLMLSKLGALDTAQATEYLTSIMNGFKIETSEANEVVAKLISVNFAETHRNMWVDYFININKELCSNN